MPLSFFIEISGIRMPKAENFHYQKYRLLGFRFPDSRFQIAGTEDEDLSKLRSAFRILQSAASVSISIAAGC